MNQPDMPARTVQQNQVRQNATARHAAISVQHRQAGVGIVEVMMSVFVLAIGALGFAALQVRAMQTTNDAFYRSQALEVAQDLAERYSLNKEQETAYKTAASWNSAAPTSVPDTCAANFCSAADLATFDINSVKYSASTVLPQGVLRMENCQGGVTSVMCVYVGWNGNTATSGDGGTCVDETGSYVADFPDCVMLEVR